MARFIPQLASSDTLPDSERLVWEALQTLPSEFIVLHSFPWLRPNRDLADEPLREGEADFVILHPDHGMLVVEVKGGSPELRERTWYRAGRPLRDPFDQARRNRYALLDAVEERTRRRVSRNVLVHGDVVVFPHCRYEGPLPLNAEPRVLLDSRSLPLLEQHIKSAFAAWRKQPTALAKDTFRQLVDALLPKLRLLRCVPSEIELERQRIVQVTSDQQATLQGLVENDRVFIEGAPGSGKTLLATEFAVTSAVKGCSVLLLCFNRNLAAWLQEVAQRDPRLAECGGALEVTTFHSFAMKLAARASVEFSVPSENAQAFWDDEVPLILEQALDLLRTSGRAPIFDVVIVDEAQDFSPDWWVTVESLTKNGRKGRLYAFADLQQSLRSQGSAPSVPLATRFRLTTNCRNTKAVARSASELIGAAVTLLPSIPEGELPCLRRAPSPAASAGLVKEEVRRFLRDGLSPRSIALIGASTRNTGCLAGLDGIDDVPFTEDASEWRRGAGILVTTARSFKGLEADVVVAYDIATFSQYFTLTDLYVTWTRARHRLVCVAHGAEGRAKIEAALAAALSAHHRES